MDAVTVFSPAKINLFLAVTGRRADGFHELLSVAAPLEFGDRLRAEAAGRGRGAAGGDNAFSLECAGAGMAAADAGDGAQQPATAPAPGMPLDETNLVLRAARAFRAASGRGGGAKFFLEKRIPVGAGLGGGSSNATATLRALNTLAARDGGGRALTDARLAEIAAGLGSDCALFLHDAPVVMRGRGERVDALPAGAAGRLRGRRVLVFKPEISVSTARAYARMAATPGRSYLPGPDAEARLRRWLDARPGEAFFGNGSLLFNNMQPSVFEKFVALPVLLEKLRAGPGLDVLMSGSGSACFALLPDAMTAPDLAKITGLIRAAWGGGAFVVETKIR
ncbi:MAG: 4-(cytidine 5'-diphospho)-2-C-methyl-D-erythritol kinase [Opitutaceae bacterium]|jgi:4-diphosphocytidyl-2-C-methyl-D-erythritol kinase|nr:4-(cytidine 5'-diphospho)-2-C-methyl-D-erythritol kinase [Opitutaceae bacterium]